MMAEEGIFSIITSYLRLAGQNENILGFRSDEYYWRDLGRPDDLQQAARDLGQWGVFLVSGFWFSVFSAHINGLSDAQPCV